MLSGDCSIVDGSGVDAVDEAHGATAGLILLFDPDCRPTNDDIREATANLARTFVSFDPSSQAGKDQRTSGARAPNKRTSDNWVELLRDGLTFDLIGLKPGPAVDKAEVRHRFGSVSANVEDATEAIGLFPGPHLEKGSHTLPVLRTLVGISADLAGAFDAVRAVIFTPSGCVLAPDLFIKLIADWQDGGPFPSPGIVGFTFTAERELRTDGLAFLAGRELALDAELAHDSVEAARLASRIVDVLVGQGPIELPTRLEWPGLPGLELFEDASANMIRACPI